MARGRVRLEWDQTASLWVPLAEPLRDKTEHPEPFQLSDVHPLLAKEKVQDDGEPNMAQWETMTRGVTVHKIDLGKLRHEHASN